MEGGINRLTHILPNNTNGNTYYNQPPPPVDSQNHIPNPIDPSLIVTPKVPPQQSPGGIVPILQNVVSTVNLSCRLDLKAIALKSRNAEYNPKRFAAVIMRIRDPKTTALIFSSGKMVCTGAKSEEQSKIAARRFAKIVSKVGFPDVKFKVCKTTGIVGHINTFLRSLKFKIWLPVVI